MSSQLIFKGNFKNGKSRVVGSFIPTNGLNNSKLLFDKDDYLFINRWLEADKKCFNWCIEKEKFKNIQVLLYIEGKEYIIENNLKIERRIDKNIIMKYIYKANTLINLYMVEKGYKYKFKDLNKEEKEKIFFHNTNTMNIKSNKELEEKKKEFYNKYINNNYVLFNKDNKEYINITCPIF